MSDEMSEKVDAGLQSIMQVRVGLVSDYCGAKEKLDADAMICALAAENAALRAENKLMAKSLDAEELRVGLSTTGGMWRFWRDKAADVVSENAALRAEVEQMRAEAEKLADALREIASSDSYETRETFDGSEYHITVTHYGDLGEIANATLTEWQAAQK